MTLPHEEADAIKYTELFLMGLTRPDLTPRVPKDIRALARRLLRHYPGPMRTKTIFDAVRRANEKESK